VALADPYCGVFSNLVLEAASRPEAVVHQGGTLVCMEGPQFSTRAESHLYRAWGASLIGMTALPEAKLAREAALCYATLALATDYDCWHDGHDSVTVEAVIEVMRRNSDRARETIVNLAALMDGWRCGCSAALQHAIVTHQEAIPARRKEELRLFLGPGAQDDQS